MNTACCPIGSRVIRGFFAAVIFIALLSAQPLLAADCFQTNQQFTINTIGTLGYDAGDSVAVDEYTGAVYIVRSN